MSQFRPTPATSRSVSFGLCASLQAARALRLCEKACAVIVLLERKRVSSVRSPFSFSVVLWAKKSCARHRAPYDAALSRNQERVIHWVSSEGFRTSAVEGFDKSSAVHMVICCSHHNCCSHFDRRSQAPSLSGGSLLDRSVQRRFSWVASWTDLYQRHAAAISSSTVYHFCTKEPLSTSHKRPCAPLSIGAGQRVLDNPQEESQSDYSRNGSPPTQVSRTAFRWRTDRLLGNREGRSPERTSRPRMRSSAGL